MKYYILPALLLVILLASCTGTKNTDNEQATFDPEADRQELVGSTWEVDMIYGKDIDAPDDRDEAYITFTTDGKVQGHTGCNPITGTYTLENGLRIKFDNMATGLAFCADVPYEGDFLEVLNTTDNYTLNDGKLSLNKARMAPLAVLEKKG